MAGPIAATAGPISMPEDSFLDVDVFLDSCARLPPAAAACL